MNERCGCGAAIEDVNDMEHIREWRRAHHHEQPPLKVARSGSFAGAERSYDQPAGFTL